MDIIKSFCRWPGTTRLHIWGQIYGHRKASAGANSPHCLLLGQAAHLCHGDPGRGAVPGKSSGMEDNTGSFRYDRVFFMVLAASPRSSRGPKR